MWLRKLAVGSARRKNQKRVVLPMPNGSLAAVTVYSAVAEGVWLRLNLPCKSMLYAWRRSSTVLTGSAPARSASSALKMGAVPLLNQKVSLARSDDMDQPTA